MGEERGGHFRGVKSIVNGTFRKFTVSEVPFTAPHATRMCLSRRGVGFGQGLNTLRYIEHSRHKMDFADPLPEWGGVWLTREGSAKSRCRRFADVAQYGESHFRGVDGAMWSLNLDLPEVFSRRCGFVG